MIAFDDIDKDDTVEVTYRGKVEQKRSTSIKIDGLWHYDGRQGLLSVEVVEKALKVGWHRVRSSRGGTSDSEAVVARYWNGSAWFYSESVGELADWGAGANFWEPVGFLGGGPDE